MIGVLLAAAVLAALVTAILGVGAQWLAGTLACTPAALLAWRGLLRDSTRPPVDAQILVIVTYVLAGFGIAIAAFLMRA